jgi:hypothetical protein
MKKLFLLLISCFLLFASTSIARAEVKIDEEFQLGTCFRYDADGNCLEYKSIKESGECFDSIGSFITCVLPNIYIVASIILLIILTGAGLVYLFSAGNTEKQAESSKAIGATLLGFVILFASYWIIQIIQVILGVKILDMTFFN